MTGYGSFNFTNWWSAAALRKVRRQVNKFALLTLAAMVLALSAMVGIKNWQTNVRAKEIESLMLSLKSDTTHYFPFLEELSGDIEEIKMIQLKTRIKAMAPSGVRVPSTLDVDENDVVAYAKVLRDKQSEIKQKIEERYRSTPIQPVAEQVSQKMNKLSG